MKISTWLVVLVTLMAGLSLALAKPERVEKNSATPKQLLKPAKPPTRSLYLDCDPNIVFTVGKATREFGLTPDQFRQLRELVLKFQGEMPKEREVAQQARIELEKVMGNDQPDETEIQRISDRAISADSFLQRGRLQFWIELRQRFGKDVFDKIQQTIFRHQHRLEEEPPKSAIAEIFPAKQPALPAKD